jgi:hypothetical protein
LRLSAALRPDRVGSIRAFNGRTIVLSLALAMLLIGAMAPAADAGRRLPFLHEKQAEHFMRKALKRRFDGAWQGGYLKRVECNKRLRRSRVRCERISWVVGDSFYHGSGVIWITRGNREGVFNWNYAYKIKRLDEYCYSVLHHSRAHCTKTYRVR